MQIYFDSCGICSQSFWREWLEKINKIGSHYNMAPSRSRKPVRFVYQQVSENIRTSTSARNIIVNEVCAVINNLKPSVTSSRHWKCVSGGIVNHQNDSGIWADWVGVFYPGHCGTGIRPLLFYCEPGCLLLVHEKWVWGDQHGGYTGHQREPVWWVRCHNYGHFVRILLRIFQKCSWLTIVEYDKKHSIEISNHSSSATLPFILELSILINFA